MPDFTLLAVKRIPEKIRVHIIEEDMIRSAKCGNAQVFKYLFDVYEHFIDNGEHDDWNCGKCKDYVLQQWIKMDEYLKNLHNESN